ncbi:hypothetical protein [Microbacterium sp. 1.5R]|uniref:hypothetical protein n=1 Tax=Microbacterium sp. 1.5R TaxID=1916917 RepID=UPI0011AA3525|nr:hypothetical protein [Microbacterium sp. 1.5R]
MLVAASPRRVAELAPFGGFTSGAAFLPRTLLPPTPLLGDDAPAQLRKWEGASQPYRGVEPGRGWRQGEGGGSARMVAGRILAGRG